MTQFYVWRTVLADGYCVILAPQNVEDEWEVCDGVSRADGWPGNVFCRMDPDFPNDIELTDNLTGAEPHIVVSEAIRQVIQQTTSSKIEWLPIAIRNHKGRVASSDYFLLNAQEFVDCINTEASKVKWNKIDSSAIYTCESLTIDESKVPAGIDLFRPKHWATKVVVTEKIVNTLNDADITGLNFIDARNFTGLE